MIIEMMLSGFFFGFIIITNLASNRFGYQTFGDLNKEANLENISKNTKKFKIGFALILIEHVGIILLAVSLFLAFNSYNLLLAVVWLISRFTEGLIQIYNKKSYWGLLNIAEKISNASNTEKKSLGKLRLGILKSKHSNFITAQIFFSIGTLAYSILFATYDIIPAIIGWFGIVSVLIYGFGNGILFVKPNYKVLWSLGGLLILIFEIILACTLVYFSII